MDEGEKDLRGFVEDEYGECCSSCTYSVLLVEEDENTGKEEHTYECHRYAPHPLVFEPGVSVRQRYATWPIVNDLDSCGDWEGRP